MARQGKSDMVMFDFTESADAKTIFKDSEPISGADFMRQNNIHGMACGYLFRQSILGDLRFSPNIYHEDEEFTPQLIIRAESIQVTNAPAYLYRKRPDSIITSTNVRHKLKRLNDLQDVIIRLDVMSDTLPPDDRVAMQRRVAQLTMDFIYKTIVETHNRHYLERKLTRLRKAGLFPLPDRNYTTKYRWFRRLANTSAGLGLLMKVLPLMNRER